MARGYTCSYVAVPKYPFFVESSVPMVCIKLLKLTVHVGELGSTYQALINAGGGGGGGEASLVYPLFAHAPTACFTENNSE